MTPCSRRSALLALSTSALLPRAALAQGTEKLPEEAKVGQLLQDAPMLGLNGPNRKLSDYRGRPLLINVWASWCGPCRAEMASLERLAWLDHPVPFAVIGISTDDYPERAQQLLKSTNATISHFIDRKLQLETLLGASRLPLTVLVDPGGRVVDKVYGARQWDSPESRALVRDAFSARASAARK